MAQSRVTKAYVLAEQNQPPVTVSKFAALIEIGTGANIRASKLSVLVQANDKRVRITKLSALIQLKIKGPYPVRVKNNLDILFDGSSIKGHIQSMTLQASVKEIDTTVISSTDVSKIGTSTTWDLTINGPWTNSLDDIFGAAISDDQDKVDCSILLGQGLFQVAYDWTSSAFVSSYRVEPDLDGIIRYEAKITLNGAPDRTSRM